MHWRTKQLWHCNETETETDTSVSCKKCLLEKMNPPNQRTYWKDPTASNVIRFANEKRNLFTEANRNPIRIPELKCVSKAIHLVKSSCIRRIAIFFPAIYVHKRAHTERERGAEWMAVYLQFVCANKGNCNVSCLHKYTLTVQFREKKTIFNLICSSSKFHYALDMHTNDDGIVGRHDELM